MPPSVVWALLIIEDFCISLAVASWGVILAKVIFLKKKTLDSKGNCKGYILAL
jgi:predicted membrane-bound mannosyltransferase